MNKNVTEFEKSGAYAWLFGVGTLGIVIVALLWRLDDRLTYSKSETVKNEMLREIRSAQGSLSTRNVDKRELVTAIVNSAGEKSH
jgi:hypothetical protein